MIRFKKRNNRKFEKVEDPCELLASLVDMGSVDIEDAFLACLSEMSAAECKRVLSKCGSGFVCPECDDELPAESEDMDDLEPVDDEPVNLDDDDIVEDGEDESEDDDEEDEDGEPELESRIRRLEKALRERCSKNEEDDEDEEDEEDMNERKRCRTESRIPVRRRFRR